jgi:hypothetical protein
MLEELVRRRLPAIYAPARAAWRAAKRSVAWAVFRARKLVYQCRQPFRKRSPAPAEYVPSQLLFQTDVAEGLSPWIFHDEDWNRIRRFRELQSLIRSGAQPDVVDNLQQPTDEVTLQDDGTMLFRGTTANDYEWLYLYLDPTNYQWDNYSWQFSIRRDTEFREFQFAFRYHDLYNRYRFRFENHHISFDKVLDCNFYNHLGLAFFPMDLGRWYRVRIDVFGDTFRCYVDDVLMLETVDTVHRKLTRGSIAVILWEDDGRTDIRAAVGPMTVHELVPVAKAGDLRGAQTRTC